MGGGMKKLVQRWPKRDGAFEEWLQKRNRVTDDRDRAQRVHMVVKRAVRGLKKDRRTSNGESDWGMISRVTKRCFGNR